MFTPSSFVRPEDMEICRRLTHNDYLSLITFTLDGERHQGIPNHWQTTSRSRIIDANITETIIESTDPATGMYLRVEISQYNDYPVVEWIAWFSNLSSGLSPVLSDVQAIDMDFEGESPVLHHCNGDFYSIDGYTPSETPLLPGTSLNFSPNGGRPCDGAFPYFRMQFFDHGYTMAIGWPAQWQAEFTGKENGVSVIAGQQLTHLALMPGESIRTPRVTLMSWVGDSARGTNLWRRWYIDHILPRVDGHILAPMLAVAGTDDGEEFTGATEPNQLRYQDEFAMKGLDYDVWWIDAGWYPCADRENIKRWVRTGSWTPDTERFPNGLRRIAENAASHGARLLLWFEPERVFRGSQLWNDHPEWLLHCGTAEGWDSENALLNLGDDKCREWLTDHVSSLIRDNNIGVYRQDFNFPPLAYWRNNESEDRQGMAENLHVQGYLKYWDDLLARHPGLWIDSCASGGRRNDLETMRRSVPLHYTDYGYGDHHVKLAFHGTLFEWIPYFREMTLSWDNLPAGVDPRYNFDIDSFAFHTAMACGLSVTIDIRRSNYDFGIIKKMVSIWRRISSLILHGDYYQLTPWHKSDERWVAWQFNKPEKDMGFIQAIRHARSTQESLTVCLRDLEPDAIYLLENPETGEEKALTGSDLTTGGMLMNLPPRSGVIWIYRRR